MGKNHRDRPETDAGQAIVTLLEPLTARGHHNETVLRDWLRIVDATLTQMPANYAAIRRTGQPAEDPPEMRQLWQECLARYGKPAFANFAQAFHILLDSANPAHPEDVVGDMYERWGSPDTWRGQFFTPMNVATMMAQMITGNGAAEVRARLKAVVTADPILSALLLASAACPDTPAAQRWFNDHILPGALSSPAWKPFTICDPCCGSGRLLLACAPCFEPWMHNFGLVQFYGMDIDQGCVLMARINLRLHGLNAEYCRYAAVSADLPPLPVTLPPAVAAIHQEAAQPKLTPERLRALRKKLFQETRQLPLLFS